MDPRIKELPMSFMVGAGLRCQHKRTASQGKHGDVTFLDVSAEVHDAARYSRYESVSNLLLGAIIATENEDEAGCFGHSRRTEHGPCHEVTVRNGSYKGVEFA